MRRVLIFIAMLVATVMYVVTGKDDEGRHYPEVGSIEYINDAKMCAVYYLYISGDQDYLNMGYLSGVESALWEARNKTTGISLEVARKRVEEELEHYLQKVDALSLRKSDATREILLKTLAGKRRCPAIAASGQNNLISEVESGSP